MWSAVFCRRVCYFTFYMLMDGSSQLFRINSNIKIEFGYYFLLPMQGQTGRWVVKAICYADVFKDRPAPGVASCYRYHTYAKLHLLVQF